jgi:hypothetical protein
MSKKSEHGGSTVTVNIEDLNLDDDKKLRKKLKKVFNYAKILSSSKSGRNKKDTNGRSSDHQRLS